MAAAALTGRRLLPSGVATYAGARGHHDDHVATLLTAAIADSLNMLPHSPTAPRANPDVLRSYQYLASQGWHVPGISNPKPTL